MAAIVLVNGEPIALTFLLVWLIFASE
jgi:hypothetical protein